MGEIRNPKAEIRKKPEIRSPKISRTAQHHSCWCVCLQSTREVYHDERSDFGFRASFGFRTSDFGFHPSGGLPCPFGPQRPPKRAKIKCCVPPGFAVN